MSFSNDKIVLESQQNLSFNTLNYNMSEFSITSADFEEGGEIPKKFGYKHGNEVPLIIPTGLPVETGSVAIIMDDPDAMKAVGKVWVHYLTHFSYNPAAEAGEEMI